MKYVKYKQSLTVLSLLNLLRDSGWCWLTKIYILSQGLPREIVQGAEKTALGHLGQAETSLQI